MKNLINGKAIYTPKGAAREYGEVGCNFYIGCTHDCVYCYLKRGVLSHSMGKTEITLKKCFKNEKHALDVFSKEIHENLNFLQKTGIFFSFSTDPLLVETRELTLAATKLATSHGVPVKILTKAIDATDWISILGDITERQRKLIAFGFTLTGCDDMEPGAPPNMIRVGAIQFLHGLGFKVFASIEPIINTSDSYKMILRSHLFCDLFLIGLRSGVKANYYQKGYMESFYLAIYDLQKRSPHQFKIYWKESFRRYFEKNKLVIDSDSCFVEANYNMFQSK